MNADGSGVRRLTRYPAGGAQVPLGDFAPAWSPDGGKIAFMSDRDGDLDIYVMNADGTGVRRLTRNRAEDASPAWQPADGRRH